MPFEENKRRLNTYLEALDNGNEAETFRLIDELFADTYVAHMAGSTLQGRDG